MGINRPSLYAAFGNKEALFRKAIDRYIAGPACHFGEALKEPTARTVVDRLLRGAFDLVTDSRNPCGCFMVQGALACGDAAEAIRRELIKRRAESEAALRVRFERRTLRRRLAARFESRRSRPIRGDPLTWDVRPGRERCHARRAVEGRRDRDAGMAGLR